MFSLQMRAWLNQDASEAATQQQQAFQPKDTKLGWVTVSCFESVIVRASRAIPVVNAGTQDASASRFYPSSSSEMIVDSMIIK